MDIDKSLKRKKKKKDKIVTEEQGSLNLVTGDHKPRYKYDKNWENRDFLDIVRRLNYKAILFNIPGAPIALSNGYGFIQILEIKGKDIEVLSISEQIDTISSYMQYLSGAIFDFTEQTTTLPTNTETQISEKRAILDEVIHQLLDPHLEERKKAQLEYRREILIHNIIVDEIVGREQYNTEFFIWIYGNSLQELESYVNLSNTLSIGFRPSPIFVEKKEQILKQYNNLNERI